MKYIFKNEHANCQHDLCLFSLCTGMVVNGYYELRNWEMDEHCSGGKKLVKGLFSAEVLG